MARYSIVKRHRYYYKYDTAPNATVVGNFARIDKGVARGFTTANYLTYPEIFNISTADSWEMECKFTTGSNISTQQHVLSSSRFASAGSSCGAFIRVYSSKIQFLVPLTSNISSYISLEYTADTDTEYVVKGEFTGTAYNLYVNGEIVATKESTSKGLYNASYNDKLCIGNATSKDCPFLGVLDLSQSYININGERWWSGDSYTKVGSWIEDGVVSGFTTANYLRVPTAFNHGGNSWEIVCKLTTGSDVTTNNQYMTTNSNQGISLVVEASHFKVNLSSNGSSFDIASNVASSYVVLPNTEYWVKVWFDGAVYRFSYSLDGEIYNTDIEVTSSKKIYDNGVLNIGIGRLISQPYLGAIDLTKSYININGERWWHGTKAVEVPSSSITDFGSYKYFKNVVTTKYWKEITTEVEGDVLAYAAYYKSGDSLTASRNYAKAPIGSDLTIYCSNTNLHLGWATGVGDVVAGKTSINVAKWQSLSEKSASDGGSTLFSRQYDKDLYTKGTISTTTRVEVTVYDDWDYTTEEITPVEVTADDEYDFTEFVPSAEFDYYEDKNKLYGLTRRKRDYYKNWTQPVNPTGITTSGWTNPTQAFDGVNDTYAYTTSNSAYIEYDFGQEVYVTGFDAVGQWVNAVAHNSALDIYRVDEDGVETLIKAGTVGSASANYPTSAEFPAVKTSKVRFKTHNTAGYQVRIREITVSGYLDGTKEDYDYYTDRNVSYNIINSNDYKTLQINAVPDNATITINDKERNSITAVKGSIITWSVEAEGYSRQKGTVTLDDDTVLNITLNSSVYEVDQVVFESTVAGTYEVEMAQDGDYEVYCIGGGSGGYWQGNSRRRLSGASGGGFIGIVEISKGIYNVTVGAGSNYRDTSYGTNANGGDSSINNIVIAGGGGGCAVTSSSYTLARAGNAPILSTTVIQETLNTSGNGGQYSEGGSYHTIIAGGASVYNGYGKGGNGGSTPGYGGDGGGIESGKAGYVKIVWKG